MKSIIITTMALFMFMPLVKGVYIENFSTDFAQEVAYELDKHNIPGAAFIIVSNNKVVALETFGHTDKTKKQKVNHETVFRLASVSKPFAATITAMLAQEEALQLSDPVTKYVPTFKLATAGAAEKIQLKHLLSHTSGLMPNSYDNLLYENWSMEKVIARFDRITPICEPEKCYGYQNVAYGFLKPAIESSQSKTYSQLLSDRIFKPLAMHNASVGLKSFNVEDNTAKPHKLKKYRKTNRFDADGERIIERLWKTVEVNGDYYKVPPAAGINASISDLGKWLIANLGYRQDVLSDELISQLTTPRIQTKRDLRRRYWRDYLTDAHYGYGWRIYQFDDLPIIYHSGWVSGFRADIGYSKELDIGFAIIMNAESNVISKISSSFWSKVSTDKYSVLRNHSHSDQNTMMTTP